VAQGPKVYGPRTGLTGGISYGYSVFCPVFSCDMHATRKNKWGVFTFMGDKMSLIKKLIRTGIPILIVASVSYFFYRAFQANWADLRQFKFHINYILVFLSFLLTLSSYLIFTYSWSLTVNYLAGTRKISYLMSIATVNTSNLTRYLPGRLWSVALQMYWLDKIGYKKSLILYVNLVNHIISLLASAIAGLACLAFFSGALSRPVACFVLAVIVLIDIIYILFNDQFFKVVIYSINRIFSRNIHYYNLSTSLTMYLHLLHLFSAIAFGIGAYLLCIGIGFDVMASKALSIMAAMLISDVVGILAIIIPSGLGVREGVMYYLLNDTSAAINLSLILPIATRILHMLVELSLGIVGYLLLKVFVAKKIGSSSN
jgi:uncharacterized membrane protein YbhN (UPF0104 family)